MYEIIVLYTPPDGEPQRHLVNRYEFRDRDVLANGLERLRLSADKVVALDERIIKSRDKSDFDIVASCGHTRKGVVEAGDRLNTGAGFTARTVCYRHECISKALEICAANLPGQVPHYVPDEGQK